MYRPDSLTKQFGTNLLYGAIRACYSPAITLEAFAEKVAGWTPAGGEAPLADRRLVVTDFFMGTHRMSGMDYVLEDSIVQCGRRP